MSFKSTIQSSYGEVAVDLVRDFSKGSERLARHSNNNIFDARCKRAHIIPPSLHIQSPIRTQRGIQIAQQASRLFLNERLRLANYAKRQVEDNLKWIRIGLQRCLNEEDYAKAVSMAQSTAASVFEKVKSKQRAKFDKFFQTQRSSPPQRRNSIDCSK